MNWTKISFNIIIWLTTIVLLEVLSRFILPISPSPIKHSLVDSSILEIPWNQANSEYLHKTNEFEKIVNINALGNRIVPSSSDTPKTVLFLGDSFTFGQGLSNDETIPNIYALKSKLNIVNLGIPGSGLVKQREKLIEFLNSEEARKTEITKLYHLLFLSSTISHSGNDFVDTYVESSPANTKNDDLGLIYKSARWFTRNSNLFRIFKYVVGPRIKAKSMANSYIDEHKITLFKQELEGIIELCRAGNIEYLPCLVSAKNEVILGNYLETKAFFEEKMNHEIIVPSYDSVDAEKLYYRSDGHFNSFGANFFARYLTTGAAIND